MSETFFVCPGENLKATRDKNHFRAAVANFNKGSANIPPHISTTRTSFQLFVSSLSSIIFQRRVRLSKSAYTKNGADFISNMC